MKNQKGFLIALLIAIVAVLAIGGVVYLTDHKKAEAPIVITPEVPNQLSTTTPNIIGGQRDEHGCLGPAGYSWCAVKNKCLRVWEEKCEITPIIATTTEPAQPIACTMDARQCPDGSYVGRSGPNCEFVCPK